jgi:hypothetical protein
MQRYLLALQARCCHIPQVTTAAHGQQDIAGHLLSTRYCQLPASVCTLRGACTQLSHCHGTVRCVKQRATAVMLPLAVVWAMLWTTQLRAQPFPHALNHQHNPATLPTNSFRNAAQTRQSISSKSAATQAHTHQLHSACWPSTF